MSSGIIQDTLGFVDDQADDPRIILEEVSADIERVTQGEVKGEVRPGDTNGRLRLYFDLFAPGVPYTYPLFSLRYQMEKGFPVEFIDHRTDPVSTKECPDRASLETELRVLFESEGVNRIVHQLRKLTATASRVHSTFVGDLDY